MNNKRNKAWRQEKRKSHQAKIEEHPEKQTTSEKNWKFMYIRSEKLKRAKQLGIDYPMKTVHQRLDEELPKED